MISEIFETIIRIAIGFLFLISGALKLPDLKGFFVTIVKYNVLKGKLAKVSAYSLPFIEIIIGFALIFKIYLTYSYSLALFLVLVSTGGVIYAYLNNNRLDNCGCYGTKIKIPIGPKKIIENLITIILLIYLLILTV
jgi:hypothetical protein